MRVIIISTDRLLFKVGSKTQKRLIRLGDKFENLTVIVFAKRLFNYQMVKLTPTTTIVPTNSSFVFNYIWDAIRLGKSIASVDLVTTQDPFETGFVGRAIARFHRAKLELQIHTDFLSPDFIRRSFLNRVRVVISRWLLPQADHIRVVSERIKKSLLAKGWPLKAEIEVRPVDVDLEDLKQAPITVDLHQKYPQFKKIILMVSRLEPEKQINLAIKSLAGLMIKSRNIGLVIVGAGSEERNLVNLVSGLKLSNYVKFEGWQESIATYYKTADLFLVTSRYEGYGLTIIEAKACGLPIVSTDVGVAREAGAIIVDEKPEVIADKISSLIS